MKTEYITAAIREYEKSTEEKVLSKRPKKTKPYGIKLPDARNLVLLVVGLFAILIIVTEIF